MTKEAPKTGFEDLAKLQRQFWSDWLSAAQRGFEDGINSSWTNAAEAWSARLTKPTDAVPKSLFEILAEQGRSFLTLCEGAGKASAGDQAEWFEHWLEAVQRGNGGLNAVNLPGDGLNELMSQGIEQTRRLLDTPALGYGRESQADYQALLRAQLEWQQANARYAALLGPLSVDTARRLRDRLAQREKSPGEEVNSLRGLYDLWVDAAEEAFAELAFSAEFRSVYGQLINATMRCHKAASALIEPQLKCVGIPTKGELEQTTRQLHNLRREVAELKRAQSQTAKTAPKAATSRPHKKAAAKKRLHKTAAATKRPRKKAVTKRNTAKRRRS